MSKGNKAKNFSPFELIIVGVMIGCCILPVNAGNSTAVQLTGNGSTSSNVTFGNTSTASTGSSVPKPSSGVPTTSSSAASPATTATNPLPPGCPSSVYSKAYTVFAVGGYKAAVQTYVTSGATADAVVLQEKLAQEGIQVLPSACSARYDILAGGEIIDGKHFLVVIGTATTGTAVWFRGFDASGRLLYEALITGPFDFGAFDQPVDYCKALKIPFDYNGDDNQIVFATDTLALSTSNLQIVNCPSSPQQVECGQALVYPSIQTSGQCGTDPVTFTYDPPVGTIAGSAKLPSGSTTTATVTATDSAGNVTSCSFGLVVVDTTKPQIIGCPTSITKNNDPGKCGAVVTWTEPTASDTCSSATITQTGGPANGSVFPVGKNTVTYTATDAAGNAQTCSFDVTVIDNEAPVPPSSLPTVYGDCTTGPVTLQPPPVATDNCGNVVAGVASPAGPYTGSTLVTWTFTDASGNKSTANQQVVFNGYKFQGFYDPISAKGGTCAAPISSSTAASGSSVQIKFDILNCDGSRASGVQPLVSIYKDTSTCSESLSIQGSADVVNNQWHYQWNTAKTDKGKTFRIVVSLLQNGVPVPGTATLGSVYLILK
jgi:hypothetical protein